ncbi:MULTISPECIES: nicotinate-nucleotide--dimethylbenzimidazole phosphoribosyltransferase [unclassified Pseudomonas]|jgi:nicotinate-nucleotide--dimethylbenzimidazole phosphoribosyltransferase|uniref:nicotinate-nucleotide--dimethylbenzimidazole phosphoribosyltransferase n=1 Tax=unclassified Pseudomonas TaxID=196821 RepID=UPI000272CC61|nr:MULTISPECIES: nicotinate-nucleotide--dimethylbenzimidazole phosphoribosyltransferase [unclassified Pseudomonas]AUO21952.1 nicotinate-nucleotide--dimethylbenzimidazole phosphoribosyltransferase [Pseudomonas sp. NC02]EJF72590.1 nicotinate-nucleotide--dimethylbenzimidazole phosphoribosyltransferase [Pseudomonas sp. Ag1]NWB19744.1 nicotinate-nucleotide--dimethylbenzimidazole phosphoribosyltransferase [Pseudomonas sp. D4002]QBQ09711.1 nicotinate-nucleotide--dimethylbenzimidazole phosphoribosyltra|eukprot:gene13313-20526_t
MTDTWWLNPCKAIDPQAHEQALARQQQLTKPAGSLGQLEAVAVQLAGLQGQVKPSVDHLWIAIFAGDHGVVAEGVSAFPQEVTGQMLHNFVTGGAAISVLARQLDAKLEVVDLGTITPTLNLPGVRHLNIGLGTANFVNGPAMTEAQGQLALQAGRDSVHRAITSGAQLFIGGEMGIGNTTAASALACALLDCQVSDLTGPGTGLNAQGVSHKVAVIERALALHASDRDDALKTLFNLGGFEIAALVGAYLACAQEGVVVLVDGFICTVAALVATRLNPGCREWLLFGHRGAEPGHRHVLQSLNAEPLLELGLRLGEGSGAALAVPLLRLACALHGQMATFAEAAVADRPA